MKTQSKWIIGIVIVIAILTVMGINNNKSNPTPQAINNTAGNAFISGCKQDASKYPSINYDSFCRCALNKLEAMYPDFLTNDNRINQIITYGYNSTETDAVVKCINQFEPTV